MSASRTSRLTIHIEWRLQVLQLYAVKTLAGGGGGGAAAEGSAEAALERLLAADEDEWDALLTQPDVQQARMKLEFTVSLNGPMRMAPVSHQC